MYPLGRAEEGLSGSGSVYSVCSVDMCCVDMCRYVWMLLLELQVAMQRACAGCVGEGRVAQCALYTALMCSQLGEERRVHSPPVC